MTSTRSLHTAAYAIGPLLFLASAFAAPRLELTVSAPFFNPSLKQGVDLRITGPTSGPLTVLVLDRDGYEVRRLTAKARANKPVQLRWDGRDTSGAIVPDEAYTFKADLGALTYFPAREQAMPERITVRTYDPRTGILAYTLPRASRVHIQAGSATIDSNGEPHGPVLKTVVDRAPRTGGAVIEQWDGMDESRSTYVPDTSHFAVSILAAPLPENAVITVGNRKTSYLEYIAHRTGTSLLPVQTAHMHHTGLRAIDDVAPRLTITPQHATWVENKREWALTKIAADLTLALHGPSAERFAASAEKILVFVDNKEALQTTAATATTTIHIPAILLTGTHTIAVNWISPHGPVAVQTLRVTTPQPIARR